MKKETLKEILRQCINGESINAYAGLGEKIKANMRNSTDAIWLETLSSALIEVSEEWDKAIDEVMKL